MTNPSHFEQKPQPQIEDKRYEKIEQIVSKDKKAFEEWLNSKTDKTKLNIPPDALRYLLIPKRILELSEDPAKVDLLISKQDEKALAAFVVEHKAHPVTNETSLKTYWDTAERLHAKDKAEAIEGIYASFSPELPANVDPYHGDDNNRKLVEEGKFGLNDYVTNEIKLSAEGDKLNVGYYWDREDFRQKGVATSFYTRLHIIAAQMGFRFIIGGNNKNNVSYFTKKLGRSTLAQIRPEFRTVFHLNPQNTDNDTFTIYFLKPEDKEIFLNPQENNGPNIT